VKGSGGGGKKREEKEKLNWLRELTSPFISDTGVGIHSAAFPQGAGYLVPWSRLPCLSGRTVVCSPILHDDVFPYTISELGGLTALANSSRLGQVLPQSPQTYQPKRR
jgi:hypothetical protein